MVTWSVLYDPYRPHARRLGSAAYYVNEHATGLRICQLHIDPSTRRQRRSTARAVGVDSRKHSIKPVLATCHETIEAVPPVDPIESPHIRKLPTEIVIEHGPVELMPELPVERPSGRARIHPCDC